MHPFLFQLRFSISYLAWHSDCRVDRALATETVRLWFDSWLSQSKHYTKWYSQLPCLAFSHTRDSVKPPPCVVDRWAGGSLTRKPKDPFAVSWPRQLPTWWIKCNYCAFTIFTIQGIREKFCPGLRSAVVRVKGVRGHQPKVGGTKICE